MVLARRSTLLVGALGLLGLVGGAAALLHLRSSVRLALDAPLPGGRPLQIVPVAHREAVEAWGDGTVRSATVRAGGLVLAGGSGVREASGRDLTTGLPTIRISAVAAWRRELVTAPEAGGLFLRRGEGWEELRSGFGLLHVRALAETAAGELLVGAREGLFRAPFSAGTLERLDTRPVRALAEGPGFVIAGGEDGLHRVESGRVTRLEAPDGWIEAVGFVGDELVVVTAAGLARGAVGGLEGLDWVRGGEDVAAGVVYDGRFWGVAAPPIDAVLRYEPGGRIGEERLPALVHAVMEAGGELLADTDAGVFRREDGVWRRMLPRVPALPPGRRHVGALAVHDGRLVVGFFDGGLATTALGGREPDWREVAGGEAWGVNALLPAGGVLYIASLRGAARFDGRRLVPIEGPGAAFSLAATRDGVAIGYGQGVRLPGATLLSAFHGLPGNQALALAAGESLFVGTPSGLGAMDGRRVRWRVTSGEGKLPHPWVTALHVGGDGLYLGTYGGGIARRGGSAGGGRGLADGADYVGFPETAGLKVNAGCLVEVGGRVYAGTDGDGLWRLSLDRGRFERVGLGLPSPRVTALIGDGDGLWIGTDEGLARLSLRGESDGGGEGLGRP